MIEAPKGFREEPYAYHHELTLQVKDLTNLGHGVARDGDWVVQVAHVLPGEKIRASRGRFRRRRREVADFGYRPWSNL